MRHIAIAAAMMLTLVAFAPAAGAQCHPTCVDEQVDPVDRLLSYLDGGPSPEVSVTQAPSGPALP